MESHQQIGNRLDLFFIDESSSGSIFWKPRGTILFNNLIKIIREMYDFYGYVEVVSPNIYEKKLWEVSGHWDKYKENMFILENIHHTSHDENTEHADLTLNEVSEINNQIYSLKPMNCPGHCLIFKNMRPLAKDLPIRMAEFGVLHRNESTGSLHGLTRVRRFQQDDAHIFCRMDQIQDEVINTLKMLDHIYSIFDLKYTIKLSTRPEKYIGSIDIWNQSEKILENVIKEFTKTSNIKKNNGDGAFYGPKIDITLIDKYKRNVQCGTIQLDFNLPSTDRFDLKYIDESSHDAHHPVIIHRAVLGSIERFIGIILEHHQGKLPIQISPYPIIIITVHKEFNSGAVLLKEHIHKEIRKRNMKLFIDIDISSDDIRDKIKSAEKKGYCYIVAVGTKESESIASCIETAEIAVRIDKKIKQYTTNVLIDELESQLKITENLI